MAARTDFSRIDLAADGMASVAALDPLAQARAELESKLAQLEQAIEEDGGPLPPPHRATRRRLSAGARRRQTKPISPGVSTGNSGVRAGEPALGALDLTFPASPEAPGGVTANSPITGKGESPNAK